MKKLLIMSIALVAIMATVLTVSAFAANTVEITGVTLSKYGAADAFNDAYANVTVNYTVTEDTAGAVDRLTFYLAAQDLSSALEGEEAKVIYIDEQVEADAGSLTFVIEKARVRTALISAEKVGSNLTTSKANAAAEGLELTFKLGGANVDAADEEVVVYNSPTYYGDVDGNKKIEVKDVTMVKRKIAGTLSLNVERTLVADVDGNSTIEVKDVTMMKRIIAGTLDYSRALSSRTYSY